MAQGAAAPHRAAQAPRGPQTLWHPQHQGTPEHATNPANLHDMPNLPGLGEFRTWYSEPGDNLGFAGAAPAKDDSETSDQGSGY